MNAQARPLLLAAFAIGFAFAGPAHGQTPVKHLYYPDADSKAEIGRALAAAKAAHKRVMIVFGSDWCVDCWVLDLTMHNPEIKPIVDENYEVVKVDIGRNKGKITIEFATVDDLERIVGMIGVDEESSLAAE